MHGMDPPQASELVLQECIAHGVVSSLNKDGVEKARQSFQEVERAPPGLYWVLLNRKIEPACVGSGGRGVFFAVAYAKLRDA